MAGEFETEGIVIGAGTATVNGADIPGLLPTTDEKAALAGTGTPAVGDPYVNDSDARMTDARTPTVHAATHETGGADEIHKGVPAISAASVGAFTSSGSGGWEDVTNATIDVTLVDAGSVLAIVDLDCEAAAATAVAPEFRVVIDGNNGAPISVDLLTTQDALAAHVHHLQTGLAVGARTCKLQVKDDGVTAVTISHWIISALGLQV